MLFAGLGSVRMVENRDLGRENAALGPQSQFVTKQTSQPANTIIIFIIHSKYFPFLIG